ncbi:hypothetical protein ACFFJT_18320 [Dyella flava]|uniref:Uncharacterized protein n=1 Tax=Dyella flava TaxID=1920170 RepID=A0ABS2JZL7_9GAMM|nr:hypothetical protein [Dyella flava]MBM7124442.1 hypothetical protein [Dyella flava]GLQ51896.1 hypothetical protein GCM10010872_33450 [Dyella flava]
MSISENINFVPSASDIDSIERADKSAAKLVEDTTQSLPKGDFSAWNCPYKECRQRTQ